MEDMPGKQMTYVSEKKRAQAWIVAVAAMVLVALASILAIIQSASAGAMVDTSASSTEPSAEIQNMVPSTCGQGWHVISSPNGSAASNILYGIAVISGNDIWAVGDYEQTVGGPSRPYALAEHWNGSTWSLVTVPQPGSYSSLAAISVVTPGDIWAVGHYITAASVAETFIIHYNGTSWTQVASPNIGSTGNYLGGVVGISSDSAWAVGTQVNQNTASTLVLYWDGSNWASVQSPSPGIYDSLAGVTATSADDMWAVGYSRPDFNIPARALTIHCTRAQCTLVTTPNSNQGNNMLEHVASLSATDVWAVGYSQIMTSSQATVPTMLHWNGEGWSILPTPPLPSGPDDTEFYGVSAVSDNAVWAVGFSFTHANLSGQTYAALWDGSTWTVSNSLNVNVNNNFMAVAAPGVNDVWTVGTAQASNFGDSTTLVERYNDPCVTPTPTPPACSVDFTDVPQGSTFYPYVHCLSCQNILGGYTTGCPTGSPCFKPSSPVTRGQLAKIVSNAADYGDVHIDQTFEDVPVGSTFYDFVARLASREIIGGYPCGGAGEPCGSGNLPYFRPNTNVTRGQNAKIVAIADNLPAPTPGQQTFEDVAVGSTFWQWVESLSTAGAVNGYPCGGAGEPCGSGNLPYFRPNAQVTRGQAAKIVSNTFFPDCDSK